MAYVIRGIDPAPFAALNALSDEALADREIFALPEVAYINAHNAAHGCFAARIDRD